MTVTPLFDQLLRGAQHGGAQVVQIVAGSIEVPAFGIVRLVGWLSSVRARTTAAVVLRRGDLHVGPDRRHTPRAYDGVVVVAEMPGVAEEDVRVSVTDGVLSVAGTRKDGVRFETEVPGVAPLPAAPSSERAVLPRLTALAEALVQTRALEPVLARTASAIPAASASWATSRSRWSRASMSPTPNVYALSAM